MKRLLCYFFLTATASASRSVFSVYDDVLAFPQFQVVFSDIIISEEEAQLKLDLLDASTSAPDPQASASIKAELAHVKGPSPEESSDGLSEQATLPHTYERMILEGQGYLCAIPKEDAGAKNDIQEKKSAEDEAKELARATERGRELLEDMDRCIYFVSGWWSYSFCYNKQIKQFHQLPPGNGGPPWPPTEDPATPSYVLGKFAPNKDGGIRRKDASETTDTGVALQTKGEARYLVQKLSGGTICDLTGKPRQIEVQFHCHPQSGERIGWIKEVTTCSYLMVIYTPRLCNDVAFLPPRDDKANLITCQEIVSTEGASEWQSRISAKASTFLVEAAPETRQVIGGIEVGAMKLVGREGKRIDKGNVASSNPEKADLVAKKEGGEVKRVSAEDLKKLELDPETVESLKKKLQEMAGDKDWTLELVDAHDGARELRGIVQAEDEDGEGNNEEHGDDKNKNNNVEGSKEEFKEEL